MQRHMVHQLLRTLNDWNSNYFRQKDLKFDSSIINCCFGSCRAWNEIGIQSRQGFKADSHIAWRAHAAPMPFPCHAEPLVRPCLIYTYHAAPMPCSDHDVLLKATVQHGRREMACGLPARFWLLPATTRSSTKIVIRSIPFLLTTIHTYDCKES